MSSTVSLRKINSFIVLILFMFLLSKASLAQENQKSSINLNINYAQFRTENKRANIEIYYSFLRSSLVHINNGDKYVAQYKVDLNIFRKDSLIKNISWQNVDELSSLSEIKVDQSINDLRSLVLPEDNYYIEMKLVDLNNNKYGTEKVELKIRPSKVDELFVSDIQLGLQISKTDIIGRFVKNGYEVIPNPTSSYNTNWPILYFYLEIFNLSTLENNSDSTYTVEANITDSFGLVKKVFSPITKVRQATAVIEINKTFIGAFFSGGYTLNVVVRDNKTNIVKTVSQKFYLSRPVDYLVKDVQQQESLSDVFFVMTEEEIDNEFNYIRYLVTPDEISNYEKLNLETKRKLLKNFWESHKTLENSKYENSRDEYLKRVKYADERYSIGGKKGWRTDRGRILLKYGQPSKTDVFNSEAKKYETWSYDETMGGIQFVFVDISGYGDLRLVHSTSLNEIQDYDWQTKWLK